MGTLLLGAVSDESQMSNSSKQLKVRWWTLSTCVTVSHYRSEFRDHFRNISRIMDCVGCDKCKLWGKVQVAGVGTALKILFTRRHLDQLQLSRSEIVALFNVLGR